MMAYVFWPISNHTPDVGVKSELLSTTFIIIYESTYLQTSITLASLIWFHLGVLKDIGSDNFISQFRHFALLRFKFARAVLHKVRVVPE